ncbi:MAG: CRISPR-associated protein Cas4 [Acidobacteriota bacterium]
MRNEKNFLDEEDLLPLSALQHLVFCERQCALIYIEQVWRDNPLTFEGSHLHHRVHEQAPRRERRGDVVICRGVHLQSRTLGVSGIADVVEFHRVAPDAATATDPRGRGACLPGLTGLWRPHPVEYKRGKPKPDHCDEVQLCAQAICLEEMLNVELNEGALFYGATQHRHEVQFTGELRGETRAAAVRLHELVATGRAPRIEKQPKCRSCSLFEICRPDATAPGRSARRFLANVVRAARSAEGEPG